MSRLAVCALTVFLVVGCFCRPQNTIERENGVTAATATTVKSPTNRSSRLQKPSQVLNLGFDEIVVESNLQVHNRVGSKNKSKIMLPSSNSSSTATSPQTNKSARSLQVQV